jgi:hypothetical protein
VHKYFSFRGLWRTVAFLTTVLRLFSLIKFIMEKWIINAQNILELIDVSSGRVLAREKRRKPPRTIQSGGRRPGRPSKEELALAEKNQPIRKLRLYEYDPVLGHAICEAIMNGERLKALDPKHLFPPFRELKKWKKLHPDFAQNVQDAEDVQWHRRFERGNEALKKRFSGGWKPERRGRPFGSKNLKPVSSPQFTFAAPQPLPEINWGDIPMLITRFGSWEAAMEYKKKLTQK